MVNFIELIANQFDFDKVVKILSKLPYEHASESLAHACFYGIVDYLEKKKQMGDENVTLEERIAFTLRFIFFRFLTKSMLKDMWYFILFEMSGKHEGKNLPPVKLSEIVKDIEDAAIRFFKKFKDVQGVDAVRSVIIKFIFDNEEILEEMHDMWQDMKLNIFMN